MYARLPGPARRLIASLVPKESRARMRYWARGEATVIDAELAALDGTPWQTFRSAFSTAGMTERVVEIPWSLSRVGGAERVLDLGTANAIPAYVRALTGMGLRDLRGVDLSPAAVAGVAMTQADVRTMPYEDELFDLILCVSTLEHIGRDNTSYGIESRADAEGDLQAMREFRRVLKAGGRLVVTVPFGILRHYDWFKQYDLAAWNELVDRAALEPTELALFGYGPGGWAPTEDSNRLQHADYRAGGAQGATGLLCAVVTR